VQAEVKAVAPGLGRGIPAELWAARRPVREGSACPPPSRLRAVPTPLLLPTLACRLTITTMPLLAHSLLAHSLLAHSLPVRR